MTRAEWLKIVLEMQARWPNREITDESIEIWLTDLADLPAEQVRVAVNALYREGREWAPNGAQVRAKVAELGRDAKDHGQAYELAMRAARTKGFAVGLDWLREQDRLVALAAERFPWREFCLEPLEDGTRRAQFREIYKLVAAEDERDSLYAGLPAAGLRSLERRPRSMGEVLGRALDAGEPEAESDEPEVARLEPPDLEGDIEIRRAA